MRFRFHNRIWLYFGVIFYLIGMLFFTYYSYSKIILIPQKGMDIYLQQTSIMINNLLGHSLGKLSEQQWNEKNKLILNLLQNSAIESVAIYDITTEFPELKLSTYSEEEIEVKKGLSSLQFPTYQTINRNSLKNRVIYSPYFRANDRMVIQIEMSSNIVNHIEEYGALFSLSALFMIGLFTLPFMIYFYWLSQQHQKNIDQVTLLPNRNQFNEDLSKVHDPMLILFRIIGLSKINYFYGQKAGDYIIAEFAKRLQQNLPEELKLCRIRDVEFALYGDNTLSHRGYVAFRTQHIEDWLRHLHSEPFIYEGNILDINITTGIAVVKESILEKAGMAVKIAENEGKSFAIYDANHDYMKTFVYNEKWQKKLHRLIRKKRILPYYQPIVNINDNSIVQYEALMRIIDGDDAISPAKFFPVAKKYDMGIDLTKLVLEKTFATFSENNLSLAINIGASDLADKQIRSILLSNLRNLDNPSRISFEFQCADIHENYRAVASNMGFIRNVGALITLDNFGQGLANFKPLLALPINSIKVDGSLTQKLGTEYNQQLVVRAIVGMSKAMKLTVSAQMVDSNETYHVLKKLKFDRAQGHLFGMPKPNL